MKPTNPTPNFYALLYIDEDHKYHINLPVKYDPADVYIRCTATLASSIASHGLPFRLLTNDEAFLQKRMEVLGLSGHFKTTNVEFRRDVPRAIPFYSAHFKLDLFRKFSEGHYGDVVCLVDVDSVMLRPLNIPDNFNDELVVYDISAYCGNER